MDFIFKIYLGYDFNTLRQVFVMKIQQSTFRKTFPEARRENKIHKWKYVIWGITEDNRF